MRRVLILSAIVLAGISGPSLAEGFERITARDGFLSKLDDRELRRFGIRLRVTEDGQIQGRAFGRKVTGAWQWNGGYFCRDLYVGADDLGPNCQMVQVRGDTMRFTSDKGAGIWADLWLN